MNFQNDWQEHVNEVYEKYQGATREQLILAIAEAQQDFMDMVHMAYSILNPDRVLEYEVDEAEEIILEAARRINVEQE